MSEKSFYASIKDILKNYMLDGILLILLGIAMLIWPNSSLKALCIIIGIALCVIGLVHVLGFFASKDATRSPQQLIGGILPLALGILLIAASGFFIGAFQFVCGLLLLYGAALMFAQAWMLRSVRGLDFTLALVFACVTLVLAVVILIDPVAFASFITQLHGISLIIEGLSMLLVLRKVKKA